MRIFLIALIMLPLMQAKNAQAQAGDPEAGQGHYRGMLCYFCHGDDGEGGFGPDLAAPGDSRSTNLDVPSASRGASWLRTRSGSCRMNELPTSTRS